jgi:hypothetical protein
MEEAQEPEVNAADTELIIETEFERVTRWRACELMRAGYDPQAAVELAEHPEIDLHLALELVERGCPPELASEILL